MTFAFEKLNDFIRRKWWIDYPRNGSLRFLWPACRWKHPTFHQLWSTVWRLTSLMWSFVVSLSVISPAGIYTAPLIRCPLHTCVSGILKCWWDWPIMKAVGCAWAISWPHPPSRYMTLHVTPWPSLLELLQRLGHCLILTDQYLFFFFFKASLNARISFLFWLTTWRTILLIDVMLWITIECGNGLNEFEPMHN